MPRQGERFTSKIDGWYLLLVTAMVGLTVVIAVPEAQAGRTAPIVISTLAIGLFILNMASTSYVVTDDTLSVRCLCFRWAVPLTSVKALRASRDLRASPALSLDRIEVVYDDGAVLVSPKNQAAFVRAIRDRQPLVRIEELPNGT